MTRPATRVGDVAIFENGEVVKLTVAQQAAIDRGEPVLLPMPPRALYRTGS